MQERRRRDQAIEKTATANALWGAFLGVHLSKHLWDRFATWSKPVQVATCATLVFPISLFLLAIFDVIANVFLAVPKLIYNLNWKFGYDRFYQTASAAQQQRLAQERDQRARENASIELARFVREVDRENIITFNPGEYTRERFNAIVAVLGEEAISSLSHKIEELSVLSNLRDRIRNCFHHRYHPHDASTIEQMEELVAEIQVAEAEPMRSCSTNLSTWAEALLSLMRLEQTFLGLKAMPDAAQLEDWQQQLQQIRSTDNMHLERGATFVASSFCTALGQVLAYQAQAEVAFTKRAEDYPGALGELEELRDFIASVKKEGDRDREFEKQRKHHLGLIVQPLEKRVEALLLVASAEWEFIRIATKDDSSLSTKNALHILSQCDRFSSDKVFKEGKAIRVQKALEQLNPFLKLFEQVALGIDRIDSTRPKLKEVAKPEPPADDSSRLANLISRIMVAYDAALSFEAQKEAWLAMLDPKNAELSEVYSEKVKSAFDELMKESKSVVEAIKACSLSEEYGASLSISLWQATSQFDSFYNRQQEYIDAFVNKGQSWGDLCKAEFHRSSFAEPVWYPTVRQVYQAVRAFCFDEGQGQSKHQLEVVFEADPVLV